MNNLKKALSVLIAFVIVISAMSLSALADDVIEELTTNSSSENVTEDTSENTSENITENVTENTSENVTEDTSEDVTENTSEPAGEDPSQDSEEILYIKAAEGADVTEELESAFKSIRDANDGKTYRVKFTTSGTYYTTSQVHIYSNTILDLTEGVKLIHNDTDAKDSPMFRFAKKAEFTNANDGKGYPGYTAGGNVSIIGGTLDGGGKTQAIFKFGHLSGVTMDGVTMTNVAQKHYVEFAASENVTFKNCKFLNFAGPWGGNSNIEALQIDAAVPEHFSNYNPDGDETISRNITVTNCTFKNLKRGVGTHSTVATSLFDNIKITNNTFENIEGYAIICSNYKNSVVSGNKITNCGAGILFRTVDGSHSNFYKPRAKAYVKQTSYINMNGRIENNTITICPGYKEDFVNTCYGIQLYGEQFTAEQSKAIQKLKGKNYVCPEGDFRVSGVTVTKNTITINCPAYGIWLQGAAKNTVTNNTITCNLTKKKSGGTGDGIRLNASVSNTLSENKIYNTTPKGGYDSDMFGINLLEGSNSNTVYKNTVSKPKKDGIKVESSASNTLNTNTITGVGRDGIHLVSAKKTKVLSNVINSSARDAVLAESSASLNITKNKVKKCRTAVNLKASKSAKIVSNKTNSCSSDAVKLEKADSAKIDKNQFVTQKRDGINIVKSNKIVITNNTIKSSKRYGINSTKKQIKKDSKNKITKSGKRARSWK